MARWIATAGMALALGACGQAAPMPGNNVQALAAVETPVAAPSVSPALATAPLGEWIVGHWSYDTVCGTDLAVQFRPDGAMETAAEQGSWKLDGEEMTVTVTSRVETDMEDKAGETKLDPPEVRRYRVERADAAHGTITLNGNAIPIQRC